MSSVPQLADLDFGGQSRILDLPAPASDNEPARLADLNSAIEGTSWKDSVRVATQSNINLSSPGATIDGITMSSADRVLVKEQSTAAENGIYLWNGASAAMTRAADASTAAELEQAVVTVEEGSSAGASYRQTSVNFTLGSGSVAWTPYATGAGAATESSAGIAELATQGETDTGTDDARIVTPLKLATWAGRPLRYSSTFGDGSSTQFDITHNLGTEDVTVTVRRLSDGVIVGCKATVISTTVVRLNFAAAVASNALRATITA